MTTTFLVAVLIMLGATLCGWITTEALANHAYDDGGDFGLLPPAGFDQDLRAR